MPAAEKLKQAYGCCLTSMAGKDELVSVEGVGGRPPQTVGRLLLAEILEARVEEILSMAQMEIAQNQPSLGLAGGLALTGGSSVLEGLVEMGEQIFNMPARLGGPQGVGGLSEVVNNPMYATAVGLLLYGMRNRDEEKFRIRDVNIFNRITKRMRKWFKDVI